MADFVDRVVLHVAGGNGGHGCASVKREKFKPLGGPDGGNGGSGGDVVLRVSPGTRTLLDYHRAPHRRAGNGTPGMGNWRAGKEGTSLVLPVPRGTVVTDLDGTFLADLVEDGQEFLAARSGQGGLGNAALASPRRRAPGFALLGLAGEARDLVLELKSLADVALVGFPSAGKSSLVSALSAAKPKIADYPFTTLVPQLGVVEAGERRFTVADVPGLIEGASEGRGLGQDFLRHIERCSVIVHVLDCATLESSRDPLHDLAVIERELAHYTVARQGDRSAVPLAQRPALVALNKVDDPDGHEMALLVEEALQKRGYRVFPISALARIGLRELAFAMAETLEAYETQHEDEPLQVPRSPSVRRRKRAAQSFHIRREERDFEPLFRIVGAQPERWVQQTDFQNPEAVGYLSDRLYHLGIDDQLANLGAQPGDAVTIGPDTLRSVIFDWDPSVLPHGGQLPGPRGTDLRLEEEAARPTRREKRDRTQNGPTETGY